MRRIRLLSFVSLVLQLAPQASMGTVQGTITRAGSAEPLRDVRVTLMSGSFPAGLLPGFELPPGRNAVSDDRGHFVFTDIPAGRYTVFVQREGFSGSSTNASAVTVAGGKTIEVNLALIPGAVIRGRVVDSAGQFVSNVTVQAFAVVYRNGMASLQSAVAKMTDDRGEYRLFGVPPGDYYVGVTPRPPIASTAPTSGTVRNVRTFYPSTTSANAATRVTLNSGEEISGIDIGMQSRLQVRISGRVLSEVTPPPPNRDAPGLFAIIANTQNNSAQLILAPRDSSMAEEAGARAPTSVLLNASTGDFEIPNVVPGSYDLFAIASGQQGLAVGRTPVDVLDRDITGLTIVVRSGVEVKGTIAVEGQAINNVVLGINLQPIDSLARINGFWGSPIQQGETGSFSFGSVPEGRFRVAVALPSTLYVEDVLQNSQSVHDSGFDVRSGSSTDPLQILVKSGAGAVEGVVVDAAQKSLPGATVALVPNMRRTNINLYRNATSDASGKFTLNGVAPGEYKVFAWPGVINGAYFNPEFLGRYEDDGHAITVTPGARITAGVSAFHAQAR